MLREIVEHQVRASSTVAVSVDLFFYVDSF